MDSPNVCAICTTAKATAHCGLCQSLVCKSCQDELGQDAFLYQEKIPEKLTHAAYCWRCFNEHVAPELTAYEAMAEKAKNVYFLTADYKGYVRILGKHKGRISIPDCADRREIILKMAFIAAELGFNAIIQSKVESMTVPKGGGHYSSRWKASSLPALIDGVQLERSSLMRL